ncbi:hypothetical protein HQQ81_11210 [Microbacteriaceae bacterium VKM Ac-2854]|nr:hypothetical protein [Microbacteriaceae bacterium VKM Ac-2854]
MPETDAWYRRYRIAMAVIVSGFVVLGVAGLALRAGSDPAAAGTTALAVLFLACVGAVIVALSYLPRVLRGRMPARRIVLAALAVLLLAGLIGGVSAFFSLLAVTGSGTVAPTTVDARPH